MMDWRHLLKRKLTPTSTGVAVLILAMIAMGIWGLALLTEKVFLEMRVKTALPRVLDVARDENKELVKKIEAYHKHIGIYAPDHILSRNPIVVDAVTNQLLYELSGTVYDPTNQSFSGVGFERVPAKLVREIFNVDRFTNVASHPDKLLSFLGDQNGARLEIHDNPDVMVLAFSNFPEDVPSEVLENFNISSWRYSSSAPSHNPKTFDLWLEIKVGQQTFVIGNWPEKN